MGLLTKYWSIDFLVAIISLVILLYFYMTRNFNYWKKRGVMEVKPIPFIGNFGDCVKVKKSPGELLQDLYNKSSGLPYMGFYVFDRPFFLARDPELIKDILIRDFNYFHDRFCHSSPEDTLGNATMFFIKNPAWKYLRSKIRPIYTSGKLKKLFTLMKVVGNDLDTHMASLFQHEDNNIIELKELCAKYTTDQIGTTAFGLQVNSLNNPDAEFRRQGRDIFNFTLYRNIQVTSMFFAPQLAKLFKFQFFTPANLHFLRTAVFGTMLERHRTGEHRGDLLDLLLELKNTQDRGPEKEMFDFYGDNLVAQAAIFFIAGFETSSTAMSLTLYELALQPDIQTRARNEIIDALKSHDGIITYDMVMELPYLDMIVSETLRKYPPLPVLDRVTVQEYKVPNSNLILEKGIPVYISIAGLHHDPQYFPNPEKYDPERFTLENKKTRQANVYLPFGDGPHACIGLRLGMLQVKLGLITLLRKYKFSPCKQTVIPLQLNPKALIIAFESGIFLNAQKIKSTGES